MHRLGCTQLHRLPVPTRRDCTAALLSAVGNTHHPQNHHPRAPLHPPSSPLRHMHTNTCTNTPFAPQVLERRQRQLFARALVGESVMDASGAWLDSTPMRPNVAYVLATGSVLCVGGCRVRVCVRGGGRGGQVLSFRCAVVKDGMLQVGVIRWGLCPLLRWVGDALGGPALHTD